MNNLEHSASATVNENSDEESVQTKRPKVGKPVRPIWSLAFNDPEAYSTQKPNSAACKHCKQSYRHHHKASVVETHLRKCKPFVKLMLDKPVSERPNWWSKTKPTKNPNKAASIGTSSSVRSQSSVRMFALPHFTATEQKKFNLEMAMHFYCTGTSFVQIEDPHLYRAIQLARPGARLPTRKMLADDSSGGLLDICYKNVQQDVKKISPSRSLFLEAVHTEQQSHDADWLTADLVRVMESIGNNIAGAITDNTATNKKVWKELERKYPNRFFHGCVVLIFS